MAIGRITGPLLKNNLLRQGVDLAFETDLLYLDVINGRIGIKTTTPSTDLDINGTARATDLEVTHQADIATFTISGDTIASSSSIINLTPSGANPVVYQGTIVTGDLQLSTNLIETTGTNTDLVIETTGTGEVNVNANMFVDGNLHATGTITADGNIQIGDSDTDGITFNAEITSNIVPDNPLGVPIYDLGSLGKEWRTTYAHNVVTTDITATSIIGNGIELTLPQGKIWYVAVNGSDTLAGNHENAPFASIKHALTVAQVGDQVFLYPGVFTEIFPLTIPAGVTLRGSGIRASAIQPTAGTIDKDAILLNGETTVEDLSIVGFRFNSANNTGYALKFATGIITTSRSPYIRNISVITSGSVTSPTDPRGYDAGDAGAGAYLDGSIFDPASLDPACLFHSVTFICPAQNVITATNGVRIEWLNSFSYFANKGVYLLSGTTGIHGTGLTRLRIDSKTGTWAVGNTVTYYDTNGTTILASGVIESIEGNFINLTGKCIGFETLTDRIGKIVNTQGDAKLSTAQKKFGTASLVLDGVGDYISLVSQPDFEYGTGDFTFEFFWRPTALGTQQILLDCRTAGNDTALYLEMNTAGNIRLFVSNAYRITSSVACSAGTFNHIALFRVGGITKLAVNGTLTPTTWTDPTNYPARPFRMGASWTGGAPSTGYIDEVRVVKGVAKYTTSVTVPTNAFSGDLNTVLLLHFNGTNNSTTILDDGTTLQDVRTNAGGFADTIHFANYQDFGSEFRSIGSACVYGVYGVYGDGDGVLAYLISTNFAYVGSGKIATNDPNDRIEANEVQHYNRAKIYYTSVDNEGNFKVGDAFYVNQKTGEVLFSGQQLSVTALDGITFSDGTNTTIITASELTTGNITITGNTIQSNIGDINVTAASGAINLQNNTSISGTLRTSGNLTVSGNTTLGDTSADTINFIGKINTSLIPATPATYNLGSNSPDLRWATVYVNTADMNGITITNNTITTTSTNTDLELIANGSGRIYIPNNDVQLDQNLTVTNDLTVTTGTTYLKNTSVTGTITQTGDINQTGNFTTSGLTQVTGNITGTGYLQLPVITIQGNTVSTTTTNTNLELQANGTGNVVFEGLKIVDNNIQSTVTNSDIILTPQGTGVVSINSNQSLFLPVGTGAQRPATPGVGMIRYNTDGTGRYEGWTGSYWQQLSGVIDVAGQTYITPELTPGAADNTIRFYTNGSLSASLDSTKLTTARIQTNNIDIQNNTISTTVSGTDINILTPGVAGVRIGNLKIQNNTITNVVAGAITEFVQSGSGYVKFGGNGGIVIPSGDTVNDRPGIVEAGMMRFNTILQLVEVYDGVSWGGVAGAGGGVTAAEASDIGITTVLILG